VLVLYPIYPFIGKEEKCKNVDISFPNQHQDFQPGLEYIMEPLPIRENPYYCGSGKLNNIVALITGGNSGIGADIAIAYLCEEVDAQNTKRRINELGHECILIPGDLTNEQTCYDVINTVINKFGKLDILVNNHAVQFVQRSIMDITSEHLDLTFKTNIYSFFYLMFYHI